MKNILGIMLLLLSGYVFATEVSVTKITPYNYSRNLCLEVTNTLDKPIKGLYCVVKISDKTYDLFYIASKGEELMPNETYTLGGKRMDGIDENDYFHLNNNDEYKQRLKKDMKYKIISLATVFAESNSAVDELPKIVTESPVIFYKQITSGALYSSMNVANASHRTDYLHHKFDHVIVEKSEEDNVAMSFVFANKETIMNDKWEYNDPKNELIELSVTFPEGVKLADLIEICKKKYGTEKLSNFTELSFYETNSDPTKGYRTVVKSIFATTYTAYYFETDKISVWVYGDSMPNSIELQAIKGDFNWTAFYKLYNQYWEKIELDSTQENNLISELKKVQKTQCTMVLRDKARYSNITSATKAKEKALLDARKAREATYKELIEKRKENDAKKSLDF